MAWLLHVDAEHDEGQGPGIVCDRIDVNDYRLPANRPVEISNNFHANKVMEHKSYHGVVVVNHVTNDEGVKLDLDDARRRATATLFTRERDAIDRYIKTQLEDRLRMNYPALPPDARTARLIVKHGVDLTTYGIKPVGWTPPAPMASSPLQVLSQQNADLQKQNEELAAAFKKLMARTAKIEEGLGVEQPEVEGEPEAQTTTEEEQTAVNAPPRRGKKAQ